MDFVTRFPRTSKIHDSVWIIVDHLTKSAHFILVRTTYNMDKLAELYIQNETTWSASFDRVRSTQSVYLPILERFTSRTWYTTQIQHNILPFDR